MSMTFTQIPESTFKNIQLNAGVLLNSFDPTKPALADSAIICATTGGVTVAATPTYTDYGSDIDNCPTNVKELKRLDSWECTIAFTSLSVTEEQIRLALGAADISGSAVTPRNEVDSDKDFADVWWVGDLADGGWVAVQLKNALSTGGLSIKSTDKGKGQLSVTLTGHYSITAQDEVPMAFYVGESTTEG